MKSTSGKKFKPNQVISGKEYDTMLKRLVKAARESENAYKLGEGDFFGDEDISRQQAIHFLYLAYQATKDTDRGAYQYDKGYESQKMTIKYNKDGTVCIVNGDGLYLDIEEGEAVSDATLIFAPKSGKSSQKFVFNYVW